MKRHVLLSLCIAMLACTAQAAAPNPYAGQETREIKALSPEDIQSYLAGKGMGFAKAAELNGYPGPSHVLALAAELGLTPEQQRQSRAAFEAMEADAIRYGRELVDEERRLDGLFASRQVTRDALNASVERIGVLQAKIREAHLTAHLAQAKILTPEQTARYAELRGYGAPEPAGGEHHHHH
jgi:Spy/CpxP family protein refolding chaperone